MECSAAMCCCQVPVCEKVNALIPNLLKVAKCDNMGTSSENTTS